MCLLQEINRFEFTYSFYCTIKAEPQGDSQPCNKSTDVEKKNQTFIFHTQGNSPKRLSLIRKCTVREDVHVFTGILDSRSANSNHALCLLTFQHHPHSLPIQNWAMVSIGISFGDLTHKMSPWSASENVILSIIFLFHFFSLLQIHTFTFYISNGSSRNYTKITPVSVGWRKQKKTKQNFSHFFSHCSGI